MERHESWLDRAKSSLEISKEKHEESIKIADDCLKWIEKTIKKRIKKRKTDKKGSSYSFRYSFPFAPYFC